MAIAESTEHEAGPAGMSDDALGGRVAELHREICARQRELLAVAAELDRRDAPERSG